MDALVRIQISYHPDRIMMINLKMGVKSRFGIPAYKMIDFGSSKLVENFIKTW